MTEQLTYNNINYGVLGELLLGSTEFTICINPSNKQVIYLRKKKVNDRDTYVSFKNLMKILPQYQTVASENKIKMLDAFVEKLSTTAREEMLDIEQLSEKVYDYQKYINYHEMGSYVKDTAISLIDDIDMGAYQTKVETINTSIPKLSLQELLRPDPTYKPVITKDKVEKKRKVKSKSKTTGILNNKVLNIYMVLVVVAAVGFATCVKTIYDWNNSGAHEKKIMDDILSDTSIVTELKSDTTATEAEVADTSVTPDNDYYNYMNIPLMSVDFNKLKAKNPDTVAWLQVNNTNINYPIVQSGDNSYYLNRAYDRSSNAAGWVFGDFRSDFNNFKNNTVIYGHGRVDEVMFGSLYKTLNRNWYTNKDNQIIKLSTPTQNTLWQVVSIYTIPVESYYLTHNFENDESYNRFLQTIQSRSIYNFGQTLTTTDKILTLSTCKDTKGNRIVMHAKLIKSEAR